MQKVRLKCLKILLCYKLFRNYEWRDDVGSGGSNLNLIVENSVYEDMNIIYLTIH